MCDFCPALILMSSPVELQITIKVFFYFLQPLYSPSSLDTHIVKYNCELQYKLYLVIQCLTSNLKENTELSEQNVLFD